MYIRNSIKTLSINRLKMILSEESKNDQKSDRHEAGANKCAPILIWLGQTATPNEEEENIWSLSSINL